MEQALDSGAEPMLSLSPEEILSTIQQRGILADALALTQTLPDLAGENPAAPSRENRRELYRRARELNIPGC